MAVRRRKGPQVLSVFAERARRYSTIQNQMNLRAYWTPLYLRP